MRIAWLAALGLFVVSMAHAGALEVKPDKENVVASRLEGKWVREGTLTQRLTGTTWKGELEFTSDPTMADKVPEKYLQFLEGKRIYMAGVVKKRGEPCPFILVELHGNPHVVYFRQERGSLDGESFNLILAPAKDKANDLLFTGGDFNNAPFAAYERAERREAK